MAKIKLGGLAQDVRGSLNGTVFSRNRGGAYVRTKVSACQPITAFNSAARAIFKAVAQYWSATLTDAQRATWEAFAALHPYTNVFGDSILLSGIAMFEACNRRIRQVGEPWIEDPPATFVVEDLGLLTAVITAAGGVPTVATIEVGGTMYAPTGLYIFSTVPGAWTRKAQRADYRLVNNPTTGLYASLEDFAADLITRFPDAVWTAAQFVHLRIQALDPLTGAASAPVAMKVTLA